MAQEASEIVSHVLRTAGQLRGLLANHFAAFGLNEIRYEVLRRVDETSPNGLSQSELASQLDQSESSISTLVDRMRRDNLLYRLRSKSDRRMRSLMLTDTGRLLLTQARQGYDQKLADILAQLDPVHISMLNMLLKLLSTELDKVQPAAPAPMELPAAEIDNSGEPDVVPMQNPAA
jgi:DNA-binding MarR family transcriptional regulator